LKTLIHTAMLAIGVALLLAAVYLAQGSFEMFPSDEQQGAVGLAMSVVVAGLLGVAGLLWGLLIAVRRGEKADSQ
jgi:hypothetical protein